MRARISYKLAAISISIAVPLFVILAVSFVDRYQSRVELVGQERLGYARLSALAFDSLIDDAHRIMDVLGQRTSELTESPESGEELLASVVAEYPASYLVLTDKQGTCVAASRQDLLGRDFSESVAYQLALSRLDGRGIEPSSRAAGERPGLHVARRIDAKGGVIVGVMLMRIDVQRLHDEYPLEVPTGGISIIDSLGQVVFQNESSAFALKQDRWGDRYPHVRAALDGREALTEDWRFPGGGSRIGAFVPVEPYGWAAGSSVDAAVPLAPFWRSARFAIPLAIAFIALGLAIGGWISDRIRGSLVTLAEDARIIGSGDFDHSVSVTRTDEIGDVAMSLEQARRDLKHYEQENRALLEEQRRVADLNAALADVDAGLHSTLDFREILTLVVERAASALEACAAGINLREGGLWVRAALYGLPQKYIGEALDDEQNPIAALVRKSREPLLMSDAANDSRVHAEFVQRYGIGASMVFPLIARDQVFGVMFFNYNDAPHEFDEAHLSFARKLSNSVSLAYENARLYAAERDVAEKLQSALLALPEAIEGVEYAVRYRSATDTARVGGDFYDLFPLDEGRVGITIGDISGHGIDAAVLTSLAKTAIRVRASEPGGTPADVLGTANHALVTGSQPESFATVLFAVLDTQRGTLTYSSGGHPAGAIVSPDGGVRLLPSNSPIVGGFANVPFGTTTEKLAEGELLFLYTDGLVEARYNGAMYGEARLLERLAGLSGEGPHAVAGAVFDDVVAFAHDCLTDDLAILAIRRSPST